MIARITGTVVEQTEKSLIVETGGIGYLVHTALVAVPIGATLTLHTHLVIRDDAHELYGFESAAEKSLFVTLIGVSGVGPKTGLQMLSLYPLAQLVGIIKTGNAKDISLVPGIGKKTAEKIVIDLKDKLEQYDTSATVANSDLVEALLSLGYKDLQIRSVIGSIPDDLPLQKQIATALQLLQK